MFDIIFFFKWRYFKCDIKIASRWRCDNKWVIAIEPNHLNGWFVQERNTGDIQRCKTVLWWLFGIIFVGEIEQKQGIWCLTRKYLNINFLFIELFHKINIIFVIMLTLRNKQHSSCDINYMKLCKYRLNIFCPHILNYVIILIIDWIVQ